MTRIILARYRRGLGAWHPWRVRTAVFATLRRLYDHRQRARAAEYRATAAKVPQAEEGALPIAQARGGIYGWWRGR